MVHYALVLICFFLSISDAGRWDGHHSGEVLETSAGALEGEGLGDEHVGLAAGLALGAVLHGLAVALGVGAFVGELLIASALGRLVRLNLGQVGLIVDVNGGTLLRLLGQATRDVVLLVLVAALAAGQLYQW